MADASGYDRRVGTTKKRWTPRTDLERELTDLHEHVLGRVRALRKMVVRRGRSVVLDAIHDDGRPFTHEEQLRHALAALRGALPALYLFDHSDTARALYVRGQLDEAVMSLSPRVPWPTDPIERGQEHVRRRASALRSMRRDLALVFSNHARVSDAAILAAIDACARPAGRPKKGEVRPLTKAQAIEAILRALGITTTIRSAQENVGRPRKRVVDLAG